MKRCVDSILRQSYTQFELLVLDNNSSDGTLDWLKSLSDIRIKIFPSEKSLSIEANWGRIVDLEKGEFITLIGHDDILEDNYLEVMDRLISQYPEASLYQSHFYYINTNGFEVRKCKPMAETENAASFLEKFLRREIDVMGTGFMMRSADYDMLGGIPDYPNLLFADFELWINLSKKNFKATAKEICFSFRLHQSTTTVSKDIKFHLAFKRFIEFLQTLREEDNDFSNIINSYGSEFLLFYCRGFSHRLLRTPKNMRSELTVRKLILDFKSYGNKLGLSDQFDPNKSFSIRLAKILDSTKLGRSIFLFYKKIYSKPILK